MKRWIEAVASLGHHFDVDARYDAVSNLQGRSGSREHTRYGQAMGRFGVLPLVFALLPAASDAGADRRGPATFLDSDDYRTGEEVVGVFLTDAEYSRMIEGVEFRGVEFDWTWYNADGAEPRRPTALRFRVKDYGTVRVPPVVNHSPALAPRVEAEVRELFVNALERLDLTVVGDDQEGNLELGVAIVDYEADRGSDFFATVDPFIELEIRLLDLVTGEPLLLVRNQDHNRTPFLGAADTAGSLLRVLEQEPSPTPASQQSSARTCPTSRVPSVRAPGR